ncbi:Rap1-interacting factor 1 N terminal-domain-containing protein [Limtongia smithiae]|uniref:Rap1-interacting factor 1 N terminal-domain-containing protein n=1 Tax=Limtongia smithiae TaxID=1125753 RepID=UPI0034CE6101
MRDPASPSPAGKVDSDTVVFTSADLPSSPPKSAQKRVNFSLSPVNIDLTATPKTPNSGTPTRRRSILKTRITLSTASPLVTAAAASPSVSLDLDAYPSFLVFLESMCAALFSDDTQTKIDVYQTLTSAIRGFKMQPNSHALLEHIATIVSCIKRDLENPVEDKDGTDSRIVVHAMRLFSALAMNESVAACIDPLIASAILNMSVTAIEDPEIKKSLLVCHLAFIGTHKFPSPRIFTLDLASRVLTVAVRINGRSRSIESYCYLIYDMLLFASPAIMLQRATEWVPSTLCNAFNPSSGVHTRAIVPIKMASRIFWGHNEFSSVVHDAFEMSMPAGFSEPGAESTERESTETTLFDKCYDDLQTLFTEKHEDHILVLWEVVVVILAAWGRRKEDRLGQWKHLPKWLEVFDRCTNSMDNDIRVNAILSWQKFAFSQITTRFVSIAPEGIDSRMTPLVAMFKLIPESKEDIVEALISTFAKMACLILRQGVSTSTSSATDFNARKYDYLWWNLVDHVVADICLQHRSGFVHGAEILSSILASGKKQRFKTDRELCFDDGSLNDIPRLNPKWIRIRATVVLQTVARAFEKAVSDTDFALAMRCWMGCITNIQSVTQREVRQSPESDDAIAGILNFLRSYAIKPNNKPTIFVQLLLSTIEVFGTAPLCDMAFIDDKDDKFVPVSSPSKRKMKAGVPQRVGSLRSLLRAFIRGAQMSSADIGDDIRCEFGEALALLIPQCMEKFKTRRNNVNLLSILFENIESIEQQAHEQYSSTENYRDSKEMRVARIACTITEMNAVEFLLGRNNTSMPDMVVPSDKVDELESQAILQMYRACYR